LPNAGTDQRPIVVESEIEQIVEIDGLVRTVEISYTEMHDAGMQRPAVIGRYRGCRC
jgi:hypothetical protein